MRRFEAFLRRTAPKGQHPSSFTQHRIKKPTYTDSSLRSGHTEDLEERRARDGRPARPVDRAAECSRRVGSTLMTCGNRPCSVRTARDRPRGPSKRTAAVQGAQVV